MKKSECNQPVAAAVCSIIEERGLKQVYVAQKAGYSKQALNDMLNGRRLIRPQDIVTLAKALEVEPAQLFQTVSA
jgi:transcriptional regulator with XRE-family HTH domain